MRAFTSAVLGSCQAQESAKLKQKWLFLCGFCHHRKC